MGLALVRDLRELRGPSSAEEIEAFETDVLAGFVLARASAGLVDSTESNNTYLYWTEAPDILNAFGMYLNPHT